MSDELDDLKARVAAARDRLASDVDFAQKVELRLNDLARIVEGSLARQGSELESAKSRIGLLETDLERALARAEQATGEASRAERLAKENGELRSMVMTLLEIIEGRRKSSLTSVMQQLEENVAALVDTAPAAAAPAAGDTAWDTPLTAEAPADMPAEPEVETEPAAEIEPEAGTGLEAEVDDPEPEPALEMELESEPQLEAEDETIDAELDEAARSSAAQLEDLSEIALYDAADEVIDPGKP
ncbi:hypothetical protein [Dongia sp.]|uniref:hypothetical protein n=1 Tax=Dongia sp. TaxID=1977262 RepID=UPI0035AE0FC2